jgi:hypothetical protein
MKLIREEIEKVEVLTEGSGKTRNFISKDLFFKQNV